VIKLEPTFDWSEIIFTLNLHLRLKVMDRLRSPDIPAHRIHPKVFWQPNHLMECIIIFCVNHLMSKPPELALVLAFAGLDVLSIALTASNWSLSVRFSTPPVRPFRHFRFLKPDRSLESNGE
jgi:hypothetical protein